MKVSATIDADRASDEFKEARRDLNRRTKAGLVRAGERVALPDARRGAGRLKVEGRSVAASLVVRSTSTSAYLTTKLRGKQNRAVGLQEHGGTVRTPILPKKAKAILTPAGPRARVGNPRHYRGKNFLSNSVARNQGRIEAAVAEEVMRAFDGLEHHP